MEYAAFSRVIPSDLSVDNLRHTPDDNPVNPLNSARSSLIRQKIRRTTWLLLGVWAMVSFAWVPFARDLNFDFFTWKFNFWMAAQGSVLLFLILTVVNAWLVNRWEKELAELETPADSKTEPAP
jgi:putative solute:sodium symporter small subunit